MALRAPVAAPAAATTATASRPPGGAETRHAARAAGLLAATGFVVGVSNFAFNVMVARSGGVAAYGGTAALLSLVTVAGFVATGVQYAIARRAATWDGAPRSLLAASAAQMWPWLICVLLLGAAVPSLSAYIGVAVTPTLLLVAQLAALLVAALPVGILIGRRSFALLAGFTLFGVALRLSGGALLARVMDPTTGALLASFVPSFLSVLVFFPIALRLRTAAPGAGVPAATARDMSEGFTAESFTGAISSAVLWSLWVMPLVFARHSLDSGGSGRFAAAQVLASGVLFVTAPVVTAFYPTIARHRHWHAGLVGAGATLALAAIAAAGMAGLGPRLMGHVYGPHFVVGARLLLEFGASAATVSLATYAVWASRALRHRMLPVAAAVGLAALLELAGGLARPANPELLAALPAASLAVASACLLAVAGLRRGSSPAALVVLAGDDE